MDWSPHYPASVDKSHADIEGRPRPLTKQVTVADIGCGFGGLLIALSPLLPDELILGRYYCSIGNPYPFDQRGPLHYHSTIDHSKILYAGLEIRTQVTQYVTDRICALRSPSSNLPPTTNPTTTPTPYHNISALRTNTMKFLPNLFYRSQLQHIFFCFPDPHFKARKHKARIVSETLCAEYAFVLKAGGMVWTITDVEELSRWMVERFEAFGRRHRSLGASDARMNGGGEVGGGGRNEKAKEETEAEEKEEKTENEGEGLFERVIIPEEGAEDEWANREVGVLVKCIREETEEGKKVARNQGRKFVAVFRRRADPPWPNEEAG